MRETTHRPNLETQKMDLGFYGMFLVQTAAAIGLFGLLILMIDRLAK